MHYQLVAHLPLYEYRKQSLVTELKVTFDESTDSPLDLQMSNFVTGTRMKGLAPLSVFFKTLTFWLYVRIPDHRRHRKT